MWEIKNLHEKLNNLPEPTRSYAMSLKAASINSQIFSVAKIDIEKWAPLSMLIAGIIVKEIDLSGLENKIKDYLGLSPEQTLDLAIEIVGSRLLIFDTWLDGQVENYLKSHNTDLSRYAALIAEQQLAIAKEKEYFTEQLTDDELVEEEISPESDFEDVLLTDNLDALNPTADKETRDADIAKRKKEIIQVLSGDFLKILNSNDADVLYEFNYSFVLVWIEDEFFHTAVSPALLANNEKVSKAMLIDGGEEKTASISNLLKVFIKNYGLVANDLNIAEFLSSKTVSKFSDAEKVLALRILKFNNNINNLDSYLQADLENVPENFEVLSPPAPSARSAASTQSLSRPSSLKDKKSATYKNEPKIAKPQDALKIKKDVALEKSGNKSKAEESLKESTSTLVDELQKILQDYAPGSLEYKTISQEIKRLKVNKGK